LGKKEFGGLNRSPGREKKGFEFCKRFKKSKIYPWPEFLSNRGGGYGEDLCSVTGRGGRSKTGVLGGGKNRKLESTYLETYHTRRIIKGEGMETSNQ